MEEANKVYNNRKTPVERQAGLKIKENERQEKIRAVERRRDWRARAAADEKQAHNTVLILLAALAVDPEEK